jgi:hypothetical protein
MWLVWVVRAVLRGIGKNTLPLAAHAVSGASATQRPLVPKLSLGTSSANAPWLAKGMQQNLLFSLAPTRLYVYHKSMTLA